MGANLITRGGLNMKEFINKSSEGFGDKDVVYSKAIKAGSRVYFLDVKRSQKDDLYLTITESKRHPSKDGDSVTFEKHKIFLYREDLEKFMEGLIDVMRYINEKN